MSTTLVNIIEAAALPCVAAKMLRRWEREGKLIPDKRTPGGRQSYDRTRLRSEQFNSPGATQRTGAYVRVSNHDRKADLERQKQVRELYYARQGWTFVVVSGLGSGMNYHIG